MADMGYVVQDKVRYCRGCFQALPPVGEGTASAPGWQASSAWPMCEQCVMLAGSFVDVDAGSSGGGQRATW